MKLGYDHRRSYYLLQNGNEDRRDYVHHYRRSYRSQVSNWLLLHILTGPRVTEADLKQEYAHHVRNNDRTNSPASHNKMDLDTITGTGLAVANIFTNTDLIGLGWSVLYHEKSPCVRVLLPQGCGLPFVSRHPSSRGMTGQEPLERLDSVYACFLYCDFGSFVFSLLYGRRAPSRSHERWWNTGGLTEDCMILDDIWSDNRMIYSGRRRSRCLQ